MLQAAALATAPRKSIHEAVLVDQGTAADISWAVGRWERGECKYLTQLRTGRAYLPIADPATIRAGIERRATVLLNRSLQDGPERTDFRVAYVGKSLAGFALVDGTRPIVHYVYIADDFRRQGVGLRLIRDVVREPWAYTHQTPPGFRFADGIGKHDGFNAGRYDPYLLDFLGAAGTPGGH
jgi:GNAT superfamily N-acetyltransferase